MCIRDRRMSPWQVRCGGRYEKPNTPATRLYTHWNAHGMYGSEKQTLIAATVCNFVRHRTQHSPLPHNAHYTLSTACTAGRDSRSTGRCPKSSDCAQVTRCDHHGEAPTSEHTPNRFDAVVAWTRVLDRSLLSRWTRESN